MNFNQTLQSGSFSMVLEFLVNRTAHLVSVVPTVAANITFYKNLHAEMVLIQRGVDDDLSGYNKDLKEKRPECEKGLWKLYLAMNYHYIVNDDEVMAINLKVTKTKLKVMKPMELINYSETLFGLYVPAVYNAYGIVESEINTLKLQLKHFIDMYTRWKDARLKRKLAGQKLIVHLKTMETYLKTHIDQLVRINYPENAPDLIDYNKRRYKGFVSKTRGNPDKAGKLAAGEIVVLDKHAFRNKKVIIVINTGLSMLEAGIGLTAEAFTGTTFAIEPGKKRRRISQKLAKGGEYILLQNTGDVETEYEVWMTE